MQLEYRKDVLMKFGIEKCAILVMKSSKPHLTDGMELPNLDKIRTLGPKENYKYLDILEADTIKHVEMKEKKITRTISREQESYSRQNYQTNIGINTWAVPLVRYSGPFLN